MDGAITFTGGQLAALLGVLFTTVSGLVTFLYRRADAAKDAQLTSLREARDAEVAILRKQVEAGERRENEWRQVALEGTLAMARVSDANNKLAGGAAR